MRIRTTSIFCILLAIFLITNAQTISELSTLGDRVVSHIQTQKPDWKYEKVQPIADSTDVILQQWTLDNCSIRIAIISHKSMPDAATAISKLAREGKLSERFQGLGDEGMMWGRGVVSFRKRNLTIDVSATNTDPILDLNEAAKNTADERKLAKEFAMFVADAIKDKQ
jgi:hypothetical protein